MSREFVAELVVLGVAALIALPEIIAWLRKKPDRPPEKAKGTREIEGVMDFDPATGEVGVEITKDGVAGLLPLAHKGLQADAELLSGHTVIITVVDGKVTRLRLPPRIKPPLRINKNDPPPAAPLRITDDPDKPPTPLDD